MISLAGFILIDDNEDELKKLHDSFVLAGYPCLPIRYMNNSPENTSGIDHVEMDVLNPRIIVTDLNLTELGTFTSGSLVAPVAALLRKIIKGGGPYVLYFWSKNADKVEEVMALLETRTAFSDIQLPINWGVIDKSEFLSNAPGLKEKIKSLITESPIFHALFDWENRVSRAAQETSNSLYSLTQPELRENYQKSHVTNMQKILAVIGNETLGHKNAKDYPSTALDIGLAPVLNDKLLVMADSNLWRDAVPEIGEIVVIEDILKPALNSFYHIETIPPDYSKKSKGVFVKFSDEILNVRKNRLKLESKLGRTIEDIIFSEFLSRRKVAEKTKAEMKALRKDAQKDIELGFIELSANCDQAQRKVRLHKYVLAALIPIKYKEIAVFEDNGVTRAQSHDGIYRTPTVKIRDDDFIVKLSFKYQIGTIPTSTINGSTYENKWLGEPRFRFKEQILADISFKCAQYSTRPGIVNFDK